jgi:hypothetical protein
MSCIRAGAVAIFLVPVAVVGACSSDPPRAVAPTGSLTHVVTAPRAGRTAGTLDVTSGYHAVIVRTTDLGGLLFRATTPLGSAALPTDTVERGQVLIGQRGTDSGGGPTDLVVSISSAVRWTLRFTGGATSVRLGLSTGQIRAVDFVSGFALIDLTLPKPHGSLPVTMSGGSTQFTVHLAGDAPARVRVAGGASTVTVDGTRRTGVAGGTTLTPPTWPAAANRYDIDCTAGVSTLRVIHG